MSNRWRNIFILCVCMAWANGLASTLMFRWGEGNFGHFFLISGIVATLGAIVFGIIWGETYSTVQHWQDYYDTKLKDAREEAKKAQAERDHWVERYVELELRLEGKGATPAQVRRRKRKQEQT